MRFGPFFSAGIEHRTYVMNFLWFVSADEFRTFDISVCSLEILSYFGNLVGARKKILTVIHASLYSLYLPPSLS